MSEVSTSESALAPLFQFREQQDSIRRSIEQAQREADAAARRNVDILTERLAQIQQSLEVQHRRELDAMQSSNRTAMVAAGALAGAGLLGLFCLAFFLMRATNRLTEAALAAPFGHPLDPAGRHAVTVGDSQPALSNPAEWVGGRFLGAIGELEKRLHELEHTAAHASLADTGAQPNGQPKPEPEGPMGPDPLRAGSASSVFEGKPGPSGGTTSEFTVGDPAQNANETLGATAGNSGQSSRLAVLLAKGQTLMNLDQASDALACFDEVIVIDPKNCEALLKKGSALERLRRTEEALECYDRAIAADGTSTAAYLHKGGVFNRLERYAEALKCYEQALQTEQKTPG